MLLRDVWLEEGGMSKDIFSPLADSDFKSDLFERLKDPHYAVGFLTACVQEGRDMLEIGLRDVAEVWGPYSLQRPSPLSKEEIFDRGRRSGFYTHGEYLALQPSPLSKEPLVEVGNSIGESVPATIDQHTVLMAEELTEPPCPFTPPRVIVEREPEAFLSASSVESREEFCGANVEKTIGGGHDVEPPCREVRDYLSQYLIPHVIEIESAMRDEVMARKKRVSEQLSSPGDHRILDAIFDERAATITEFAYRIFAIVK